MTPHVHIIFDLDGTLVDSAQVVRGLIDELRAERGLQPIAHDSLVALMSVGGVAMMQGALNLHASEAEAALKTFRARYAQCTTLPSSVYAGVQKTLAELMRLSIGLSICTNKPRALALKVLQETGLLGYFVTLCAGDDLPTRKPDVRNFQASLPRDLPITCKVFMVGDSSVDQALAQQADVPFLFFSSGYDDGVKMSLCKASFQSYEQFPYDCVWESHLSQESR